MIREFQSEDEDIQCSDIPDLLDPKNAEWRQAVHTYSMIILSVCGVYGLLMILTTTRMCIRKKITLETKMTLLAKYTATLLVASQLLLFLQT